MAKVSQASLVEHKQLAVLVRELFPEIPPSFFPGIAYSSTERECLYAQWGRDLQQGLLGCIRPSGLVPFALGCL